MIGVRIHDERVTGFEALARWHHPERGWIPPSEFIPIAEQAGLISRIGLIVLNEAVTCLSTWQAAHPGLSMSVNVSARQLMDRSLVNSLPVILAQAKLSPGSLCLEVTETTLLETAAIRTLTQLRGLGVKIAVNDFGTGHSSLAYLRKLPVGTVKLDRGVVTPLGTAQADRFFTAIVDLARTLNLKTVAEGCETWEQWKAIDSAGCDMVQGWLVAPAMDALAALDFLETTPLWNRAHAAAALPAIVPSARQTDVRGATHFGGGSKITIEGDGLQGEDVFFAAVKMSRLPMTLVDSQAQDLPLVFANQAFELLTGYGQAEIIGRNCRFLQGPQTDPQTVRQIREALAAKQEVSVELINYRKDGSSFWNAVRITPVFDMMGNLVYFFGSQIDGTRRNWL